MYVCSRCKKLTINPYQCTNCGNQSNNFLLTDETMSYKIEESGLSERIFKPIELLKETRERGENGRTRRN